MHRIIYLDSLILLNTIVTYILLLTVRSFGPVKTGTGRLIAASFIGGAGSLIILARRLPMVLTFGLKLSVSAAVVMTAFFVRNVKRTAICFFLFFILTFTYGGVMYAASNAAGEYVYYHNGVGYIGLNFWGIILINVLTYTLILLIRRRSLKKTERFLYDIELTHNGKTVNGKALFDSGHSVTDCYTGLPVVIAGEALVGKLIGDEPLSRLKGIDRMTDQDGAFPVRVRYIPVRTISGNRLLPAFTCSKASVRNSESFCTVSGVSLAVANHLSELTDFDAIINQQFFEGMR